MKKIILKTEKLSKSYILGKVGNNVLKNIDLEIYEEDFTIIMGSSGSGKSTLLYAISGMDRDVKGTVYLKEKKLSDLNEKDMSIVRKKDISFVFQSVNLLTDMNAFENVAYSGYGVDKKSNIVNRSKELLKKVGLENDMYKYPSELSGGQQQRVAIARALITNSEIIFGDEPTGALNSNQATEILDMLTALNEEGKAIIMVTHDIKAATRANRLLYLEDGRITGELLMPKYQKQEQKEREAKVFDFLNAHSW